MADPVTLAITTGGGGTTGPGSSSGLGGFVLPPAAGSGSGDGGGSSTTRSRVGWVRQALTNAGRKDRLKWAQAIDVAADEENIDPVVLALVVSAQPGTLSAGKIREAARALSRAFYQAGTVQGAWEQLGGKGKVGGWIPGGYQINFGDPINTTVEGSGGGGGGGGGGSSSGGGSTRQPPMTPEQSVNLSVYKSLYREEITNPWVVIKNGKISYVSNTKNPGVPPKGSLRVRRDEFLSSWSSLNDVFETYIGRRAKAGEAAMILKKGWSKYTIQEWLSKKPGFKNSPLYQANAAGYAGVGRDLLGADVWSGIPQKDRDELLRKAIVQGWDQATFAEKLRARPEYLKGVEFQSAQADLMSVYENIYGIPGGESMRTIQEAALARWTPDQFGAWLRGQPGYKTSVEYQTKVISVLEALGAIVGSPGAALVPGSPSGGSPYPSMGQAPDSPRIPGAPVAPTSPLAGLTPTFA